MTEEEKKLFLEKVDDQLDLVRPALESDGGNVSIIDFQDGVLFVEMHGSCEHCPSSTMTLKFGIERILIEAFPNDIKAVELA